jgi:hypothetical protein
MQSSMGELKRMPFITPRRLASVSFLLALSLVQAHGADIGGSIRFSDESFSLTVHTTNQALRLNSHGCNNFDLILPPAERNAAVVLRDREGRSLGTVGYQRTIETRTCGADSYATEFSFDVPTQITWTPQADELVGGKRVKYVAQFAPRQVRFDPPVELTIYENNSRARPLRIAEVAAAQFQAAQPVVYSSNSLHFVTPAGTIERRHGFATDDEFFLESESQHFARPANGAGERIAFEAPSSQTPTALSLYYPPGGPHILAFTANERGREPTPVKSLRVDDEQLLTPQFAITQSEPLTVKRSFFRFAAGDQIAQSSVRMVLGSAGSEVSRIHVASSDPTTVQLATSAAGPFSPSVDMLKIAGGTPIEIAMHVRTPADAATGIHNYSLTVTSDGGLKRVIPITLSVSDPFARTRSTLLAAMIAVLIAAVTWTLIRRRSAELKAADKRAIYFQKHYGEYSEIRERIEMALASDITWLKAADVLESFAEQHLQEALTAQQWNTIQQLATQQKARESLETLDRAVARLEG